MGAIKSEVFKIKDDIDKAKTEVEKYRVGLMWCFYSGGTLLLSVFWWIFFPPEQAIWTLISNSCFVLLIISFWISYWIISKIKANQRCIGGLRIKLRQIIWEKICDCEGPCDCKEKVEKLMVEEDHNWSDGILTEVKHEL